MGVTYVPWDKVKPEELESFCEGGMLDSDTLNPGETMFNFFHSSWSCNKSTLFFALGRILGDFKVPGIS